MYERPPVKVKVEPRSTFMLTRDRPSTASILFRRVKITLQWKWAFREFAAMFTLYRISQLRRRENHTGSGFCSHTRTVISARFQSRESHIGGGSSSPSDKGGGGGGGGPPPRRGGGGRQKNFFRSFGPGGGPFPESATAHRIGVYTIPDSFSCRPEKLWGIEWTYSKMLWQQRRRKLQKGERFDSQNNNSARAAHFLVRFFAVTARLRREIGLTGIVNKRQLLFLSRSEHGYDS